MYLDFLSNFALEEKNDEYLQEDSPVAQNVAKLANNQHRLFSDSDRSNIQELTIRKHNFSSLVKRTPFQQILSSQKEEKLIDVNFSKKGSNDDSSPSSYHKGPKSGGIGIIMRKTRQKDKSKIILCEYSPTHKTYPRGILKPEELSKYHRKYSSNSPENRNYRSVKRKAKPYDLVS